ncbi:MAG: DMT family transporter [Oscillospiraceae bacterium]|nr:DMT family transporter [Oscillospiraceae bacterium]OLA38891.1 MAG: EamA family transporter [Firmicutes bacterium CAG:176_63_11]
MKYNQMRQVVFPILAAFIWGTAFVAQDLCADSIGAFAFNATRYFIAVLALLVVILISDKLKKNKPTLTAQEKKAANKQLWLGGLCCGAALAIASNFQQAGLVAGTDAGKAGFITALYVVLVPVFGLFFKRKVSLPTWIAVVLSVVALYLLCIKGDFSLAPGDLLVLVCAVCFAVHILVIDHFTAYCDGVKLSCLQFLFAGIISTICMFIFEDVDFAAILSCALPLLYVGIFSCGVGYTLQILAQKDSNPTVVTILLSLESVFAVIAGAIILKQQMTVREYIGCAIMFAAVILAQIQFPTRQKAE